MDEVKEYVQLTVDDYLKHKEQLMQELNNLANGFIRAGYHLKKIRDAEAYRNDGYESIYEFAQKEFGITRTVASRFMSINDRFSEGGYSLELMEQYRGLGSSRLTEMLTLDAADHEMITNVTRIEDIRELKKFEKQEPEAEATSYAELYRDFFEGKEKEFNAVMQMENVRDIAEIVNPSGNKTWKYRMLFMAMKEYDKGISIKDLLKPVPDTITWEQFVEQCRNIFVNDSAEAGTPYEQNYKKMENTQREKIEEAVEEPEESKLSEQKKEEPRPVQTEKKKTKSAKNIENPQCDTDSGILNEVEKTTEMRCEKSKETTREKKISEVDEENEVCDIAQTTNFLNEREKPKGFAGIVVTIPADIGDEIYAIEPESMDEDGRCKYRYTIIKPYMYEIRGKNNIKMYYHKDSGESDVVDIRKMKERRIYPDIVEVEEILEMLEELNGEEE